MVPIYSTLFDVEITSLDISEEERKTLQDCIHSVSEKLITFRVMYDTNTKKIVPIEALLNLKSKRKFDVVVSVLGKDGEILGSLIYKECNAEVDFANLFNFSHSDFVFGEKEVTMKLYPDAILYNDKEI